MRLGQRDDDRGDEGCREDHHDHHRQAPGRPVRRVALEEGLGGVGPGAGRRPRRSDSQGLTRSSRDPAPASSGGRVSMPPPALVGTMRGRRPTPCWTVRDANEVPPSSSRSMFSSTTRSDFVSSDDVASSMMAPAAGDRPRGRWRCTGARRRTQPSRLADPRVVTERQALDELVGIRHARGPHHAVVGLVLPERELRAIESSKRWFSCRTKPIWRHRSRSSGRAGRRVVEDRASIGSSSPGRHFAAWSCRRRCVRCSRPRPAGRRG